MTETEWYGVVFCRLWYFAWYGSLSFGKYVFTRFYNPKIFEYDTLTSEEKMEWPNDVFIANPPLPRHQKGGKATKIYSSG